MTPEERYRTIITCALAVGLLLLFGLIVWFALRTYNSPPRLADPAPSVQPTPGKGGKLPQQYRAAYDPNARLLGVLAIVTPLLTTIVGFYFGQRTGDAHVAVARSESRGKEERIARVLAESDNKEALQLLRSQGLIAPGPLTAGGADTQGHPRNPAN
ncbi:hypothetical protein [Streptomyces diastatochromogenes]|uniref:hypothetical protein n=1 Tax=Streptomyces diastatochromogenes TaxID=42236 RepID=UPI0036C2A4DF